MDAGSSACSVSHTVSLALNIQLPNHCITVHPVNLGDAELVTQLWSQQASLGIRLTWHLKKDTCELCSFVEFKSRFIQFYIFLFPSYQFHRQNSINTNNMPIPFTTDMASLDVPEDAVIAQETEYRCFLYRTIERMYDSYPFRNMRWCF